MGLKSGGEGKNRGEGSRADTPVLPVASGTSILRKPAKLIADEAE